MESGSVLSEPLTLSAHRGYPTDRSASMTIISSSSRSLSGQPRMSQLENLEAKMANIEVSLSSSNLGRRRKGTSIGGSVGGGGGCGGGVGTISARSSPRPESKELRSALQDREAVIQNLRIQLCLGKLPRPTGPPLDESEKPAAEQKLLRLKTDAENKRIAIRNLKSALDKLDITDNIDVRIRQAELEYALGREELQLLSIVEEARALQARLDKSKPESNSLYSILSSGFNLSLHAVQATVGRWAAHQKPDCPGLYVEWALDGEGLFRGDRILEVNGKIGNYRTREELQKNIGSAGKCQLVVVRKKTTSIPHQQLLQQQEDNLRLQHRISYLEEQVRELQASKESPCSSLHNGTSGHVTSINISSPQLTPPDKPQIFQRGNFVTTLVGGKPIELSGNSHKSHITKTIIKENGSLTDTENNNYMLPVTKSLSASKISISSEQPLLNYCYRRDRERRERQVERNLIRAHSKLSDGNYQHIHSHNNHRSYNHARSVEHLNYSGERKKNCDTICSSVPLSYDQQTRKMNGNDLRSVRSLDFDSDINEDNNNKKRNIDYTSEPVTPRIRPTPPKKPLRLSLQRAQSLQTVELPSSIVDIDKKRCLKRTHNSDKPPDLSLIQLHHTLDNNGSINNNNNNNNNHIINNGNSNSNSNSNNCNSNSSVVPLHTASLGRQKHI